VFIGGIHGEGPWYQFGPFNLDQVAGRLVVDDFEGDGRAEPAAVYDLGGMMRIYQWRSTGSSFERTTDDLEYRISPPSPMIEAITAAVITVITVITVIQEDACNAARPLATRRAEAGMAVA